MMSSRTMIMMIMLAANDVIEDNGHDDNVGCK